MVQKTGFKVVIRGRGGYYSCTLGIGKRQRYRENVPTKRRKGWGPLCLFEDKESAIRFTKCVVRRFLVFIFEAEYVESAGGIGYMPDYSSGRKLVPELRYQERIPHGTVFADEVTPRRLIKPREYLPGLEDEG